MFLASTRYALIACRYLTRSYLENRYCSAPEIADAFNINVRALMPALRQLTRAGILRSRVGGKEPGFIYTRHPSEISLLEVFTILEGDNEMLCCTEVNPTLKCDCETKEKCFIFTIFGDLTQQTKMKLAAISIEKHSTI